MAEVRARPPRLAPRSVLAAARPFVRQEDGLAAFALQRLGPRGLERGDSPGPPPGPRLRGSPGSDAALLEHGFEGVRRGRPVLFPEAQALADRGGEAERHALRRGGERNRGTMALQLEDLDCRAPW